MAEIERPSKGTNGFQSLIADIIRILGPSSGINSADVDPSELQSLMKRYSSSEADWGMFALNDNSRSYVRNLIDKGNGKANILLLVWNPGRGSMIHDHSNSHCIMKVLKGSLKETLYNWPDPSLVRDGVSSPLVVQKEAVFQENEVTYISGERSSADLQIPRLRWLVKMRCDTSKLSKVELPSFYMTPMWRSMADYGRLTIR